MHFAHAHWRVAAYLEPAPDDAEAVRRRTIVERFMRHHGAQLVLSHLVVLEARHGFSRVTGEREPREWQALKADFDGRLSVDPMNGDLLRRERYELFSKYARKMALGKFDTAVVVSVKPAATDAFCPLTRRPEPWPQPRPLRSIRP